METQVWIKVLSRSDAATLRQRHFLTAGCIMHAHERSFLWAVTGETEPGGLRLIRSTATLSGVSLCHKESKKGLKRNNFFFTFCWIAGGAETADFFFLFLCGGGMNCKSGCCFKQASGCKKKKLPPMTVDWKQRKRFSEEEPLVSIWYLNQLCGSNWSRCFFYPTGLPPTWFS